MDVFGEGHRRSVRKAAAPVDVPTRCSGCGDLLLPATGAAEVCFLARRGVADAPTVAGHYAEKVHVDETSTILAGHKCSQCERRPAQAASSATTSTRRASCHGGAIT